MPKIFDFGLVYEKFKVDPSFSISEIGTDPAAPKADRSAAMTRLIAEGLAQYAEKLSGPNDWYLLDDDGAQVYKTEWNHALSEVEVETLGRGYFETEFVEGEGYVGPIKLKKTDCPEQKPEPKIENAPGKRKIIL